jgi:KDO2-lipid IV(A) lauroyltransferase
MYYPVYGLLYLISLLPLFILYRISDFAFFIIYHVVGYRKNVVLDNLRNAFPELSDKEIQRIAKRFYLNFTDTFIETIKMLSMSKRQFNRMVDLDLTEVLQLEASGKSIQFHAGHQFNWEFANWKIAMELKIPVIGVYMKIKNKIFNKIFYDMRAKHGTVLVETKEFKNRMHSLLKDQYAIGLAADQNPRKPEQSYWLHYFNRPAPFVTGPDKSAIKNATAVVFMRMIKVRRGRYRFETVVLTDGHQQLQAGELTLRYRDLLEETIKNQPDNYLWSHRRWKWEYKNEFRDFWIDTQLPK